MGGPVVVLAGGSGGAKLARGLLDVVADDLVVIANTGDDLEIHGAHVSPDPDLVTFWLTDRIHRRGWGLRDDTFVVMDALRELGAEVWFSLGDRDLALGLERRRRLEAGERLTDASLALARAQGARARVLPMCDQPVRTRVRARGRWWGFQEWMIRGAGREAAGAGVEAVDFAGILAARPTPEVMEVLDRARAIVIGPSNPVISIGPILEVPGMRAALLEAEAPVVAVSPLVQGRVVKGPTARFLAWAGHPPSPDGIVEHYRGLIDGLVSDERALRCPTLVTDVRLDTPERRRRVAEETLAFAAALRGSPSGGTPGDRVARA